MEAEVLERGWVKRGIEFFFPPAVTCAEELRVFVAGEASYLAQKTVIGYCRVKTLLAFEKLMKEPLFRDGLDIARWEAYSLTLGDVLVMTEAALRPESDSRRNALVAKLKDFHRTILECHLPPHRVEAKQDWTDRIAAFETRIDATAEALAAAPESLIQDTAAAVLEIVPLHGKLKRNDHEVILGDLGFHMVALRDSMRKRFRREALLADLIG